MMGDTRGKCVWNTRRPFPRHDTNLVCLRRVSNLDLMTNVTFGYILGLGLLLYHCIRYYLSTTLKSKNPLHSIVSMYHVHYIMQQICLKSSQ
jgi:hypothetical protein